MKLVAAMTLLLATSTTLSSTEILGSTINAPRGELYTRESHPEEYCMALNIYHEARSDNMAGQFAVADVTLNRVRDRRWPDTVCDVVTEGKISQWWLKEHNKVVPIKHKCQFSWYCDGKPDDITEEDSWRRAQTVAYQIMHRELFRGITEGATHYHATYVDPSWNRNYRVVGRIGAHIFYRSE